MGEGEDALVGVQTGPMPDQADRIFHSGALRHLDQASCLRYRSEGKRRSVAEEEREWLLYLRCGCRSCWRP
jgi:hypothetical protein